MSHAVRRRLALWFTFGVPVGRRDYFVNGLGLMVAKYAIDATVIGLLLGVRWTPVQYLSPTLLSHGGSLGAAPAWFAPALALWTLPFVWIGVGMSMRRALDAGWSAWSALLFFLPGLNYVYLAALCLAPPRPRPAVAPQPTTARTRRLPGALMAMAVGVAVGLGMVGISVYGAHSYGASLFFGTPFALGAVTGFLFSRRYPATPTETVEVVVMTLLIAGGALLLFAIEGAVCLAMALPLIAPVAIFGGLMGRAIARYPGETAARAAMGMLVLPVGSVLETRRAPAPEREIRTAVVVDAPPDVVWGRVIAFPPLAPPSELMFRLGVAAPLGARIAGTGVGAVRTCEFTTGDFVEPITAWEPGRRLAFDVREQPDPLRELNPFGPVDAPHLRGTLRSRRGEFLLTPLDDGRTLLEGRTWISVDMDPNLYWAWMSERIVHRIHERVLEHIRGLAERDALARSAIVR
jgi:hypothetical protein